MAESPAGWYPDPLERFEHRYWDGRRWTEHAMRAGRVVTDPMPVRVTTVDDGRGSPPDGHIARAEPEEDPGDAPAPPVPTVDRRTTVADAPGVTLTDPVPAPRPATARRDTDDDPPVRDTPTWPPRLPGRVTERVRPAPSPSGASTPRSQPLPTVSAPRGRRPRLSVTAVLSLALALLWLGGVGSLAAVVLGGVALRRIRRSGGTRTGRGAALVGTVLGSVGVLATVAAVLLVRTGELPRPPLVPDGWIGGADAAESDR